MTEFGPTGTYEEFLASRQQRTPSLSTFDDAEAVGNFIQLATPYLSRLSKLYPVSGS